MFKLLLVIIMMIQPTMFSYAMASMSFGMDHSQHQTSVSTEMSHGGLHSMGGDVADAQHQNHGDSANPDMSNDCCNSAMCCPAAVVDVYATLDGKSSTFSASTNLSWEGVNLPTEIKPPRRFLG